MPTSMCFVPMKSGNEVMFAPKFLVLNPIEPLSCFQESENIFLVASGFTQRFCFYCFYHHLFEENRCNLAYCVVWNSA